MFFYIALTLLIISFFLLYIYISKLPNYRIIERTNKFNEKNWVIQGKIFLWFYGLCDGKGDPEARAYDSYNSLKAAETKLYEFEKELLKTTWKTKIINTHECDYAEFLKWKEETDKRHEKVVKE